MKDSIGLYIPNSDYKFQVKKLKAIENHIAVITKEDEVIVYKQTAEKLQKKFILITKPQERKKIVDIFLVLNPETILVISFVI